MSRERTRIILRSAILVAGVATADSLWFGLGLGLMPCALCWYPRILMYPLVVVLGVATFEARLAIWRTVVPLSGPGGMIAVNHSVLQATTTTVLSMERVPPSSGKHQYSDSRFRISHFSRSLSSRAQCWFF